MTAKPEDMHIPEDAPVTDPAAIAKMLERDKFWVRWFNYSPMSQIMAKKNNLPAVPTGLLTTKGCKSGKWIELPIYYFLDGENFVVIGSNGGAPNHTKWFLNLQADPNCKFYARWRGHKVKARVATGDERQRIWTMAAKQFPDYNDYAKTAAPREIPVLVLEKQ